MVKYNINKNTGKDAAYRSLVNPKLMNELKVKIYDTIVRKKMYRDKNFSARLLADELDTNTRYISAVVNVCFNMNYTSLVNKYRIEDAKTLLSDKRYDTLRMEDIGDMVGFSNRQSFYASFYKYTGKSPKQYRIEMANK